MSTTTANKQNRTMNKKTLITLACICGVGALGLGGVLLAPLLHEPTINEACAAARISTEDDTVRQYLENGGDVNARNHAGETILMSACMFDQATAASIALLNNADINLTDNEGNTALHIAAQFGSPRCVERLLLEKPAELRNNSGFTPLISACAFPIINQRDTHDEFGSSRSACIIKLLQAGSNVNATDNSGMTALHYAAWYGNLAAIQFLLDGAADTTLRDKNGQTAADIAAERGFQNCVIKLRSANR